MSKLTDKNIARLSLVAAFCEDMRNNDQEIYNALQDYLNRRWRPKADMYNVAEK